MVDLHHASYLVPSFLVILPFLAFLVILVGAYPVTYLV